MDRAARTTRVAVLALAASFSACSSVAWRASDTTATWRGATLREADLAGVVAANASDAEEAYRRYERVAQAIADHGLGELDRPLLVVGSADEPLPCGDADRTLAAFRRWNPKLPAVTTTPPQPPDSAPLTAEDRDLMLTLALRATVLRAPKDAEELALPAEWSRRFAWVLLLPSDSCLSTLFDRTLDRAIERENLGFGQRLLLVPLLPLVRSKGRARMLSRTTLGILSAALADRKGLDPAAVRACVAALGIDGFDDP